MLIQSEAYRENLNRYGYKGKVALIPNWAPASATDSATKTPHWIESLPEDRFLLTFAGNIGKAQSLDSLIKVARALPEGKFHIAIVGDGAELANLKMLVAKENIKNVIFYGRKPLADMPHLFERSSCLYVSLAADRVSSITIP